MLIRDVLSRLVVFLRPSIASYGPCLQTSADCTTLMSSSLPTSTTGTFGSSRSTCYKLLSSLQQPSDQSTLNCSPPRFSCGEPHVQIPFFLNSKTRSSSHSVSCLGGHLQIHGDIEPSPIVLGEKTSMERKPDCASSGSPPRLLTSTQKDSTRRQ